MFCREQVAQLVEWHPRFEAAGIRLTVIGSGSVAQAKAFAEERSLPFALLTDPSLRTYQAAGMKRGMLTAVTPGVFMRALRTAARGHRQGATQGTVDQQGGAFLVLPGGECRWMQVSEGAGEHFDPAEPLRAFQAPSRAPDEARP